MATWRGKAILAGRRLLVMSARRIEMLGHLALNLLNGDRAARSLEDIAQQIFNDFARDFPVAQRFVEATRISAPRGVEHCCGCGRREIRSPIIRA